MATQSDLARGWMQKGDSDRLNAERTVHSAGPYDTACFHCQQAVEKYLKAILAFAGQPIPRTHDLEDVYNQVFRARADHVSRQDGTVQSYPLCRSTAL